MVNVHNCQDCNNNVSCGVCVVQSLPTLTSTSPLQVFFRGGGGGGRGHSSPLRTFVPPPPLGTPKINIFFVLYMFKLHQKRSESTLYFRKHPMHPYNYARMESSDTNIPVFCLECTRCNLGTSMCKNFLKALLPPPHKYANVCFAPPWRNS